MSEGEIDENNDSYEDEEDEILENRVGEFTESKRNEDNAMIREEIRQNVKFADFLDTNCANFNRNQWKMIEEEKSGAEVSRALEKDGSSRYDLNQQRSSKCFCLVDCTCGLVSSINILFLEAMYKIQRDAIIEKNSGTETLSYVFSPYVPPRVVPINIRVRFQIRTAAEKNKQIEITVEEGLEKVISVCRDKFPGASKTHQYKLFFVSSGEELTEANLFDLKSGTELKLHVVEQRNQSHLAPHAASIQIVNSRRQALEDVKLMTLPITRKKFHIDTSQFAYIIYWAADVLNGLNRRKIDVRGRIIEPPLKECIDCLISLQRSLRDLRFRTPSALVCDAQHFEREISRRLETHDLLSLVSDHYPELITASAYDLSLPPITTLYSEQAEVLDLLHHSILSNSKLLIGYRVPPSGGKTSLSIAIASMLRKNHPTKQLLYVCYNTLVRIAVATGCHQSSLPYWVAAYGTGEPTSTVRVSRSAQLRNRAAIQRARKNFEIHGRRANEGSIKNMWRRAKAKTSVSHVPIIISDIVSAFELLHLSATSAPGFYPGQFVLYLDEPTAGAENGYEGNSMQEWVAKLLTRLPTQTVMLSATLPDISSELPTLAELVGPSNVKMVLSNRLPVGAVAVGPNGNHVLPHELAQNFSEFQEIVAFLANDALMQRFYTPHLVRRMLQCVSEVAQEEWPPEFELRAVIPYVGDLSHHKIRKSAIDVLTWIASLPPETGNQFLLALQALPQEHELTPIVSDSFIQDHIRSEGRSLAVTTTFVSRDIQDEEDRRREAAGLPPQEIETISDLVQKALVPERLRDLFDPQWVHRQMELIEDDPEWVQWVRRQGWVDSGQVVELPDVLKFVDAFQKRKERWGNRIDSLLKAGKSEEAERLQRSPPIWDWPLHIAGFSANLSDEEIISLDKNLAAYLLSGIGVYVPSVRNTFEQSVVMREAGLGHLACLFSSPDIVYGTNMGLVTVYIGKGYGSIATRNSLYQLIGRAGRTGKSFKAKVLFQDEATMRKAMIPDGLPNREAEVMDHFIRKAISDLVHIPTNHIFGGRRRKRKRKRKEEEGKGEGKAYLK